MNSEQPPPPPLRLFMCLHRLFSALIVLYMKIGTLILTAGCVFDTGSCRLEKRRKVRQQLGSSWAALQLARVQLGVARAGFGVGVGGLCVCFVFCAIPWAGYR